MYVYRHVQARTGMYELVRACTGLYELVVFTYQRLNLILSESLQPQRQLQERMRERIHSGIVLRIVRTILLHIAVILLNVKATLFDGAIVLEISGIMLLVAWKARLPPRVALHRMPHHGRLLAIVSLHHDLIQVIRLRCRAGFRSACMVSSVIRAFKPHVARSWRLQGRDMTTIAVITENPDFQPLLLYISIKCNYS
jgi:hypothetical protein